MKTGTKPAFESMTGSLGDQLIQQPSPSAAVMCGVAKRKGRMTMQREMLLLSCASAVLQQRARHEFC
jgi:hypothetical protein